MLRRKITSLEKSGENCILQLPRKRLISDSELFRRKLKIANGENATFQWEIVLARHMILSWPLSFSFSTSAPQQQQTMRAKDRGKCFKNNVCAALFGKSGKEMVYSS